MAHQLSGGINPKHNTRASSYARELEGDWRRWLRAFFGPYTSDGQGRPIPFAEHHDGFWEWVGTVERDVRPHPYVAIWPRGQGKSTNAEMACVRIAAAGVRNYALYVSETQDQADDHVQNIASMLESEAIEQHYPGLADRKTGKYGNSKGWRRNRLRTASGFTVDAIGLDSAARGAKVDEDRPGLMVFDDIDGENDSTLVTEKKIRTLTRKLLPAGSRDLAVLAVQNLVHPSSIFSRLYDGSAKFLADRTVSGPIPAIYGLTHEDNAAGRTVLTGGEPSWEGMTLARCQEIVDDIGLPAFLAECQHLVDDPEGKPFKREWWKGKNRFDAADEGIKRHVIARWVAWDTANKKEETNAFTACVVGDLTDDRRLLIRYVNQERHTFDELPGFVVREMEPFADGRFRVAIIEDAASGQQLIPVLRASGPDWLRGRVQDVKPMGKEESWAAASLWCRRGLVWLPQPSAEVKWLFDFEEQLFKVPDSHFKDMADAFALLINYIESQHEALSQGFHARGGYGALEREGSA